MTFHLDESSARSLKQLLQYVNSKDAVESAAFGQSSASTGHSLKSFLGYIYSIDVGDYVASDTSADSSASSYRTAVEQLCRNCGHMDHDCERSHIATLLGSKSPTSRLSCSSHAPCSLILVLLDSFQRER